MCSINVNGLIKRESGIATIQRGIRTEGVARRLDVQETVEELVRVACAHGCADRGAGAVSVPKFEVECCKVDGI